MNGCAEGLFCQLVQKLSEIGEIEFESMFVDGTKIEANANKYSFVWAKAVEKNLVKLDKKAEQAVISMSEKYGFSEGIGLERAVDWLHSIAGFRQEEFVYGKGRRKTELQKDCEKLEGYLKKCSEYAEKLRICGNRKSYSKTDLEATFMRMKDDHMGNGQLKPGYNLQIGVESEYIVGLELFSNPNDTTTLLPFLERTAEGTGRRYGNIVADAGYASEENYTYLESTEQNTYIKPADHELKKTRKFKKNIYHKDDMPYNAESDSFTCPNDKRLLHAYDRTGKTDNGCMILKSYYVCEDCSGCSRRENCFKGQYENRKTELSKQCVVKKMKQKNAFQPIKAFFSE